MTPDEAKQKVKEQNEALADKSVLLLTVTLDTPEQADEILRWMYAEDKPMKSELVEIAWDKAVVPKAQADALEQLRDALGA